MIRVEIGQRVESVETGMVGTVVRVWNMSAVEWWVQVKWDDSTMEACEVEPFDEDSVS